jgi:hypothetical protein
MYRKRREIWFDGECRSIERTTRRLEIFTYHDLSGRNAARLVTAVHTTKSDVSVEVCRPLVVSDRKRLCRFQITVAATQITPATDLYRELTANIRPRFCDSTGCSPSTRIAPVFCQFNCPHIVESTRRWKQASPECTKRACSMLSAINQGKVGTLMLLDCWIYRRHSTLSTVPYCSTLCNEASASPAKCRDGQRIF